MSRKRYIQIRVTEDELQEIKQRAGNVSTSTFLRKLALHQPIAQTPAPNKEVIHKCDPGLIREVNHIGNNINQITRLANSQNASYNQVDIVTLRKSLDLIAQSLANIEKYYTAK